MLRGLLIIIGILVVCFGVGGCKKEPSRPVQGEQVKSTAEYKAQADKDISSENMKEVLDRIESEVEQEPNQE